MKFEGEGVDDYGGPYREIFQLICNELQISDHSTSSEKDRKSSINQNNKDNNGNYIMGINHNSSAKCFLPILYPTPNFFSSTESEEKYRYMFCPGFLSDLQLELYGFLGQFVGIAIRSKITLDLPLPSFIWKSIAGEPLSEKDLESFDAPAARFIDHLGSLYARMKVLKDAIGLSVYGELNGAEENLNSRAATQFFSVKLNNLHGDVNHIKTCSPASILFNPSSPSPSTSSFPSTTSSSSLLSGKFSRPTINPNPLESVRTELKKRISDSDTAAMTIVDTDEGHPEGSDPTLETLSLELQDILQDLDWTYVRSDNRTVELIPDGLNKKVYYENIEEYLHTYVTTRLKECETAISAFRSGLSSIVPESAFILLNWKDIEKLICGCRSIDIQRLKDNTEYDDDVTPDDAHILMFWEILEEFSDDEKSSFLKFVWARPTLPPKGVDFLQKMKIQIAVGDEAVEKPDQYLPKAHTCFFSINLPRYSSKKVNDYY